jgi:hypothetical protein
MGSRLGALLNGHENVQTSEIVESWMSSAKLPEGWIAD